MAAPDLLKGGYIKYMPRWMEYAGFHLPIRSKTKSFQSSKRVTALLKEVGDNGIRLLSGMLSYRFSKKA